VVDVLFLIALVAATALGSVLWHALKQRPSAPVSRPAPARRAVGPDDDPEFLRELGERLRREGDERR
jgi:hypothetical protein